MKRVIYVFSILMVLTYNAFTQDADSLLIPINEKGFAEYTEVVPVDSVSKDNLYINALEWMNKTYKSGKSVIQTTDKEGGMIIGKAATQTLIYNNMGFKNDGGYFSYTISIFCKDNRYKYVIENITLNKGEMWYQGGADLAEKHPHNWTGINGVNKQTKRNWNNFQIQADTELRLIIGDLKGHMKNAGKKDNW